MGILFKVCVSVYLFLCVSMYVSVSALILGLFNFQQMHTIPIVNLICCYFLDIPHSIAIEYVHMLRINISLAIIEIRQGCISMRSLRVSMTFGHVHASKTYQTKRAVKLCNLIS